MKDKASQEELKTLGLTNMRQTQVSQHPGLSVSFRKHEEKQNFYFPRIPSTEMRAKVMANGTKRHKHTKALKKKRMGRGLHERNANLVRSILFNIIYHY